MFVARFNASILLVVIAATLTLAACGDDSSNEPASSEMPEAEIAKHAAIPDDLLPEQRLARDLLKELVEIDTTDSKGDNTKAAQAMAARLIAAGFPEADVQVLEPAPRKGNLVARYRGRDTGRKPLLLLAHIDVVEANPEDWTLDPFTFTEQDGYY
jgi:acetylornithine deacetylase/succinyl-diaminopimelate desuccinylase-like protein